MGELLAVGDEAREPSLRLVRWEEYGCNQDGDDLGIPELMAMPSKERSTRLQELRSIDKEQFLDHVCGWLRGMLEHRDPVRDRLTLFWHGFFPTSIRVTLRRYELIRQHRFLRRTALAGFGDLLHGIVRDAAMLGYFDNDSNSKEHPNENFARELLELYSLGEGNYTEVDVREAARCLTGYQGESGHFVLNKDLHDEGEKVLLGQRGNFDGDDLAEILLGQEACARYVSRALLSWFEGSAPTDGRVDSYAAFMREHDYDLAAWIHRLSCDPDFYRDEVIGQRVAGPLEWLVSTSRRLGVRPSPHFLYYGAAFAGQQLYAPPCVTGWDEGEAWITHSSLFQRADLLGALLGLLTIEGHGEDGPGDKVAAFLAQVRGHGLGVPDLAKSLTAAIGSEVGDEACVRWAADNWLGREADIVVLGTTGHRLQEMRKELEATGPLLQHSKANEVLLHCAHTMLSSPIAHLA